MRILYGFIFSIISVSPVFADSRYLDIYKSSLFNKPELDINPKTELVDWRPIKRSRTSSEDAIKWYKLDPEPDYIDPFAPVNLSVLWTPKIEQSSEKNGKAIIKWYSAKELKTPSHILVLEQTQSSNNISQERFSFKKIYSLNRSIVLDNRIIGPDVNFLVPLGFRWNPYILSDISIRGWSRRKTNQNFLAWNDGDAVGQVFSQFIQKQKWSLGASLGIRSLYTGSRFAGGETSFGEGVSAGFRFDYELSDTSGIAFGGEQLIHFDNKTDTGRDIYLVYSKAWWLGGNKGRLPLAIGTIGTGTGYLGRNKYLRFGCSNSLGGAGISTDQYFPLCWGPVASASIMFNPRLSLFTEFNNFALVSGASIVPIKKVPLRATWGVTLAQDFGGSEDYRFEFDKARWFFRLSLAL